MASPPVNSCCARGECLMKHLIYDPGEEFGFVYTSNNTIPGSNVNFIALNVPKEKAASLGQCIMTCMAHHAVHPGIDHSHQAHGAGFYLLCKLVTGERKQALARTHTTCTEPWTTLYELIPMFDYGDDPTNWGARPKFPDPSKEKMATAILDKWVDNHPFRLKGEGMPREGKVIDLAEALLHVDDWDVDWKDGLTAKEIKLVRQHSEWFHEFALTFFRKARGCSWCKKLWEPPAGGGDDDDDDEGVKLLTCGGCKQVFYCNRECQIAHWKKVHKKQCKLMRSRLDPNDPSSVSVARALDDVVW